MGRDAMPQLRSLPSWAGGEEVKKRHKSGMFRLRMAFGKAGQTDGYGAGPGPPRDNPVDAFAIPDPAGSCCVSAAVRTGTC